MIQGHKNNFLFQIIGKQDEKLKLEEKIILVQSESIENLLKSEQILEIIEEQNKILKIEMSESREELAYEREKQRSMEDLLINLNTDKGAIVAR